jgi:hypothetical protein
MFDYKEFHTVSLCAQQYLSFNEKESNARVMLFSRQTIFGKEDDKGDTTNDC